jgi:hypothetical protein
MTASNSGREDKRRTARRNRSCLCAVSESSTQPVRHASQSRSSAPAGLPPRPFSTDSVLHSWYTRFLCQFCTSCNQIDSGFAPNFAKAGEPNRCKYKELRSQALVGNDGRCSVRLHSRSSEKTLPMNVLDRRISVAPMMDYTDSRAST